MVLKTTTSMICKYSSSDVSRFLTEYCSLLFSSGSTCIRLEKNITRIASAYGMETDVSVFPRHIHLTVHSKDDDSVTSVISIHSSPTSFAIIFDLSRLSWDIADRHLSLYKAEKRFKKISNDRRLSLWVEMLLIAVANAAFCRLFQGDIIAMLTVFAATIAGISVRQTLVKLGLDIRASIMICSTVSTVISAADALFNIGSTPEIAVAASVLYLIPGIPLINSFCDMIDAHYICAFGRMMNAIVVTACLSTGFILGITFMNLKLF